MSDKPRLEIELMLANGVTVKGIATHNDAVAMATRGSYIWKREMADAEKQRAVIETQVAMSIEKQSGVFVMAQADGSEWLIANQMIVGALVRDTQAAAPQSTFGFRATD